MESPRQAVAISHRSPVTLTPLTKEVHACVKRPVELPINRPRRSDLWTYVRSRLMLASARLLVWLKIAFLGSRSELDAAD